MTSFERPDWAPAVKAGTRVLITGASGGLGRALVDMLLESPDCIIGAHGGSNRNPSKDERVVHLEKTFETEADCVQLVEEFADKAGGIDALVVLSIYDVSGKLVRTLVSRRLPAGRYTKAWDGRDANGGNVASGIYFYRLKVAERSVNRKAVLLR